MSLAPSNPNKYMSCANSDICTDNKIIVRPNSFNTAEFNRSKHCQILIAGANRAKNERKSAKITGRWQDTDSEMSLHERKRVLQSVLTPSTVAPVSPASLFNHLLIQRRINQIDKLIEEHEKFNQQSSRRFFK